MKHLADQNRVAADAAARAKQAIKDAAGAVMVAEIEALANEALAAYRGARAIWGRLDGLMVACPAQLPADLKTACLSRPPLMMSEAMALPLEELQGHARGVREANEYLARLCADPMAEMGV